MTKRPLRIYVDTSVFGGVFDDEFERASLELFDQARRGKCRVVVSSLVIDELMGAPDPVRAMFHELRRLVEVVGVTEQAIALQRAYLDAGIVGPMRFADALHVAVATVSECWAIVSWNFKHIVNFRKVSLYNWVNTARGYGVIAIHSPQEVIFDEEEDV